MSKSNAPNTEMQPVLPGVLSAHAQAREALDRFSITKEGREIIINRYPTSEEREVLTRHRERIDVMLRPTSYQSTDGDKLTSMLSLLFSGYAQLAKMDRSEASTFTAGYVQHLQHLPLFALARACEDISRNRVPGLNKDHPPAAPRIGHIAEDYVAKAAAERRRCIDVLHANLLERQAEANTAESIARVQLMHQQAVRALGGHTDVETQWDKKKTEIQEWHREQAKKQLLNEWAHLGEEPKAIAGIPISVGLARLLRLIPPKPKKPDPASIDSLGAR